MALEITWHFVSHAWINSCQCHRISHPLSRQDRVPSLKGEALRGFCCPPKISLELSHTSPWSWSSCTGCVCPSLCSPPTREIQLWISALQGISAATPWLSCSKGPSRGLRLPQKNLMNAQHLRIFTASAVCSKPGCSQCDVK